MRDLRPDVVLVYHAINDICWGVVEPFYLDPTTAPRPESHLEKRRRELQSFFFEALWHRVFHRKVRNPKGRAELHPKIVSAFGSNLKLIRDLALDIGAVPVFMTFEARISTDFPKEVREAIESQDAFQLSHMTYDGLVRTLAQLNATTRSIAKESGVDLIELENRLPRSEEYWTDFVHLNEEGTRLKTEKIYEGLLPVIENVTRRRPRTAKR